MLKNGNLEGEGVTKKVWYLNSDHVIHKGCLFICRSLKNVWFVEDEPLKTAAFSEVVDVHAYLVNY